MINQTKQILKPLIPSVLDQLYQEGRRRSILRKEKIRAVDFKAWWRECKESKILDPELVAMIDYFSDSQDLTELSNYWNYLNRQHILQLADSGYENFKRTVARSYFTWLGSLDIGFCKNLFESTKILDIRPTLSLNTLTKQYDNLNRQDSINYNIITTLLYNYVISKSESELFPVYDEPVEGNGYWIELDGTRVSQDVLNSLLELYTIDSFRR